MFTVNCQGEEKNNHYEIYSRDFSTTKAYTQREKTTSGFHSWGKEISPTPATSRLSVSHKRKKNSQQGSRVQENRLGTLQSRKERRGRENAKPLRNTYKGFSLETQAY